MRAHGSGQARDAVAAAGRARARLPELEGLRALAILSVMLFHYLQRFVAYYPYGKQLLPAARYGWLGVYLFFVISGFVIALTLHRTRSPVDFAVRRIARLLPAMALCATLTFCVMWWIDTPFTRAERVGPGSFLPALTFTDPWLWAAILPDPRSIDGAYWSLFVEVRFYFWAALAYFLAGPRRFLPVFLAGALAALAACPLIGESPAGTAATLLFFPDYLPLFCAGMIAQALHAGARGWPLRLGYALFGGLSVWSVRLGGPVPMLLVGGILLLFVLLVARPALLRPLTHPALMLVGACSYSLYLLHQNIGVALITLLPRGWPPAFHAAAVLAIGLLLAALAHLVFRAVERPAQGRARAWLAARGQGISRLASP